MRIYSTYIIIFAVMSAIGIAIGILISNVSTPGTGYDLTAAVLQGLAAGTLIYVVVFEVLQRERSKNVSGLVQLLFVLFGFCTLMAVVLLGELSCY